MIVSVVMYAAHRKRRQKSELIAKFIENGRDVPEEILLDFAQGDEPRNNLQRGIRGMGIGLGLGLFLGFISDWDGVAAVGFLPFFIGLARVIIWKMEEKKAAELALNGPND